MAERHCVWKPRASRYFYCCFVVGEDRFRVSTKATRRSDALAFVEAWKRARTLRSEGGGAPRPAGSRPHGGGRRQS